MACSGTVKFRFNEDEILKELRDYVESTYEGHYSHDGIQSIDLTFAAGHGVGFCVGNILKYARRYGKKAGQERRDIFKILHYAVLLLHLHDKGNIK